MRMFVVRHGESTWNVEHRLQGQVAHVPLTDLGRRQARGAAERLAGLVDASRTLLVSSDQVRALDTARIIGGRLALPVSTTPLLREQSLGSMEGRLTAELRPEPVPDGLDISEVSWHGSETIEACHRRARRFVAGLDPARDTVAVTHGTFAAVLLAVLDGRSHRDVDWSAPLGNAAIVERDVKRAIESPWAVGPTG